MKLIEYAPENAKIIIIIIIIIITIIIIINNNNNNNNNNNQPNIQEHIHDPFREHKHQKL